MLLDAIIDFFFMGIALNLEGFSFTVLLVVAEDDIGWHETECDWGLQTFLT
jgi:hypothetical protein